MEIKHKILKIIIAILLLILMIFNFGKGFLGYGKINFKDFQNDSEFLVFSKLYKDEYNLKPSAYGLTRISENSDSSKFFGKIDSIEDAFSNYDESNSNIEITDYKQQFGLQGHIFSFLYNKLHIPFSGLKLITCTLLSFILLFNIKKI